ncbi:MAG: hypothetical protein ACJAVO_002372 [Parvibaculaceae bacterium]|jgi:uncharacterized protein (DUF58 family)|nr:DUF58 domain-containing protein [Parvibaculaceae bacterium]
MRPSSTFLTLVLVLFLLTSLVILLPVEGTFIVLIIWGAVGFVALLDLLVSPGGRAINIEWSLPKQMFVGDEYTAHFRLTRTNGRQLPGGGARLEMGLDLDGELGDGFVMPLETSSTHEVLATSDLRCQKRGLLSVRRFWIKYPSLFNLFEIIASEKIEQTVAGVPNIKPALSGDIAVRVQAELFGNKRMDTLGDGSEFHQLTDYSPGMDTRTIDWRRSARHGTLLVRENQAERNHQIILCLDNGHLMREKLDGLPKIDRAINSALAVTWAAGLGGDLVGFYGFDSRPNFFMPPLPGRVAFNKMRTYAAGMSYSYAESNHTLAMAHLNGQLNHRSLIIVFSDFVDTTTAELLVENLSVLNKHHLLVYVALKDPMIGDMMQAGDGSMEAISLSVSAAQVNKERMVVLDKLRSLGVMCLDVEPEQLTPELISTYIDIKARELI